MLIRKMTPEDVAEVVAIEHACFAQPWSEKSFLDSLRREDTIFLVCEDREQLQNESNGQVEKSTITGYVGMYVSFEEANITNVAVSPKYRKRGCGEQLIIGAKTFAQKENVEKIFLEVRVSNESAISLYKKTGFENLGVRKKFYEHPVEDAYIMSCSLVHS